jgi:hypothetical protein
MATWAPRRGQTTQQAQNDASNSPVYRQSTGFATGQAQSQQSPYSGSTPYQKNPAGDFAAYSPSSNTTLTQTYRQGSSPFGQAPQMPAGQQDGNWANYASPQRPSPFQATYGSPVGGQYEQPNFAQRDAFIQNINNQMAPYMTGQASGPPQFNFNQAWSNAGQMVNDGWQNPFTAVSQQSFPSQYQAPAPPVLLAAPPSTPPGIRARGPGDPPEVSPGQAQPSRYRQELERMKAQGSMSTMTAGPGVQGFPDPPSQPAVNRDVEPPDPVPPPPAADPEEQRRAEHANRVAEARRRQQEQFAAAQEQEDRDRYIRSFLAKYGAFGLVKDRSAQSVERLRALEADYGEDLALVNRYYNTLAPERNRGNPEIQRPLALQQRQIQPAAMEARKRLGLAQTAGTRYASEAEIARAARRKKMTPEAMAVVQSAAAKRVLTSDDLRRVGFELERPRQPWESDAGIVWRAVGLPHYSQDNPTTYARSQPGYRRSQFEAGPA